MKVINLFAGPGAGKSTTAAGLFHLMKVADMRVELVTEFAKDCVWQKRWSAMGDQLFLTANQNHRLEVLRGQVDWVVTDSPILLGAAYASPSYPDTFVPFLLDLWNTYDNVNFYINRVKRYQQYGRKQNPERARYYDQMSREVLDRYEVEYTEVDGDAAAPQAILDQVLTLGTQPAPLPAAGPNLAAPVHRLLPNVETGQPPQRTLDAGAFDVVH